MCYFARRLTFLGASVFSWREGGAFAYLRTLTAVVLLVLLDFLGWIHLEMLD